MSEAAPIVNVEAVHYAYHATPALRGLTLSCRAGERVVLLGANGSGKSTLLKLLDALAFPAEGSVSIFGRELTEEAMQDEATAVAFRRRVGFVFQDPDIQLFCPTVFDELAFGPLQLGWPREAIRRRITETLERFAIGHLKDRAPHRLSGGEKKRVALASVLILEPDLLLLDEPTSALDPQSAAAVIDLLVGARGTGRTIVTATHDLDIVEAIADRCIVLEAGRVAACGTPREVLSDVGLLTRCGLAHAHLHAHAGAGAHSHHHLHRDGIWHDGD